MKILIIWFILIIGTLVVIDKYSCNPKNSLAAQINWAGNPECK